MAGKLEGELKAQVRPILDRYCLKCHSSEEPEGDIDLQRFTSLAESRRGSATWRKVVEVLDKGEMPPPEARQPKRRGSPGPARLGRPLPRFRGPPDRPATRAGS